MKITMIGTGYVGLVTATCFAEMGNTVTCVDTDENKLNRLKHGEIPIYEPGLESMVLKNQKAKQLFFTSDLKEALHSSNICFIAVGTPMDKDGSADLKYVLTVAKEIGQYMEHEMLVVDKSTVPVGTADFISNTIAKELENRKADFKYKVVSNPEFLKEGSAVGDCMSPDRVVIGVPDEDCVKVMKELYAPFLRNSDRMIVMDVRSAEMTKYASNAMLATRISFMNEMANICEAVGADINMVRQGMGSDHRIGYSFLFAGCGYGGSCFPKDVQALIKTAREYNCQTDILESVERINVTQKLILVNKVEKRFGKDLKDKVFGVWGLAFKPETDDMREAPSIIIIRELLKRGAKIKAYDPQARKEAQERYFREETSISYCENKYEAIKDVDAILLITEWKEFRSPDFGEMKMRMKNPVIFDGRNQYNKDILSQYGFEYYQIGVSV